MLLRPGIALAPKGIKASIKPVDFEVVVSHQIGDYYRFHWFINHPPCLCPPRQRA